MKTNWTDFLNFRARNLGKSIDECAGEFGIAHSVIDGMRDNPKFETELRKLEFKRHDLISRRYDEELIGVTL